MIEALHDTGKSLDWIFLEHLELQSPSATGSSVPLSLCPRCAENTFCAEHIDSFRTPSGSVVALETRVFSCAAPRFIHSALAMQEVQEATCPSRVTPAYSYIQSSRKAEKAIPVGFDWFFYTFQKLKTTPYLTHQIGASPTTTWKHCWKRTTACRPRIGVTNHQRQCVTQYPRR